MRPAAEFTRSLLHPVLQFRVEREQLCSPALPLDCYSGKVGGDFSESLLFGAWAARLLTIHGEGAEHLALR